MAITVISKAASLLRASRIFNRVVNGVLERSKTALYKENGILGLSVADLTSLHILLKTQSKSNDPLDIAEEAEMDKGAFNRCLKSLEDQGLVELKRDGSKVSCVKLKSEGKKVARLFEEKLNRELAKLYIPQDLDTAIARIGNDVAPK